MPVGVIRPRVALAAAVDVEPNVYVYVKVF
jgi:hypothetical protein